MNTPCRPWTLQEIRERLTPPLRSAGAQRAIVFGSHARQEADASSDLDLVIIAETDLPFLDRFRAFTGVFDAYRRPMEMLVYTPDEFAGMIENENPFIEQVVKDGVIIYEG